MRGNELFNHNDRVFRADHGKDSGDDFGLPKTGSSSTGGGGSKPGSAQKTPVQPPKKKSSGAGIFLAIIFLAIIIFVVYWFLIRKPPVKVEPVVQQDTTTVQPIDTVMVTEPEPMAVDTVQELSEPSQIATINSRTGRYYVVISASIDSDLANDYAMKLSQQGVQCTILSPPIERKGYFKLSVADFETLAEASTKMEELKGTFGSEIWVLKY